MDGEILKAGVDLNFSTNAPQASREAQSALEQLTAAMRLQAQEARYLSEATTVMGGSAAATNMEWLRGSANSHEYGQRMDYLRAQMSLASTQTEELTGQHMKLGTATEFLSGMGGPFANLSNMLTGNTTLMTALGTAVGGAAGAIGGFVVQSAEMLTGMLGFQIFQDAAGWVEQLASQIQDLSVTTERNVFAWQYLFDPQGGDPKTAGRMAATGLSDWSAKFSMQVPYTRQDLMGAITAAAPMGLSQAGLEHYMPIFADLASTAVSASGDPVTLMKATYAITHALKGGMTRMLQYDLQIKPSDLVPYGLKLSGGEIGHIENPEAFLPALEAYAKGKGRFGAASGAAHNTFWGGWSSLIDRFQNLGIEAGGTSVYDRWDTKANSDQYDAMNKQANDLAGAGNIDAAEALDKQIEKFRELHVTLKSGDQVAGGYFDTMKHGLDDISRWIDEPEHWAALSHIADMLAQVGGGAFVNLRGLTQGLFEGVASSGVGDALGKDATDFITWLKDPKTQQQIHDLGVTIGTDIGDTLKAVDEHLKTLGDDLAIAQSHMSPQAWGDIGGIATAWATGVGEMVDETGRLIIVLADAAQLMSDINHGNWTAALADANRFGQDLKSSMSWGLIPGVGMPGVSGGHGSESVGAPPPVPPIAQPDGNGRGRGGGYGPETGYGASVTSYGPSTAYGAQSNSFAIYGVTPSWVESMIQRALAQQAGDLNAALRTSFGYGNGVASTIFSGIGGW